MPRRSVKKPKGIGGFLINAHIPNHTEKYLRQKNYRVERPPKRMPDHEIVQRAKRERMVLITQNSHMRKHVSSSRHPGVVIIHGRSLGSEGVTGIVDNILSLFRPIEDIAGLIIDISQVRFSITFPGGIRERHIPLK